MPEVKYYRNTMTGIKSQPHRLGTTEDGRGIYMALEGWEPLDENEEPIEVAPDAKGTWII
jgi:C4-dicarboxylate-specific signal transduction histidine kinase